jgi:preprotein translocase subunit Sec63
LVFEKFIPRILELLESNGFEGPHRVILVDLVIHICPGEPIPQPEKVQKEDSYSVLCLQKGASLSEIKSAYKIKITEYHPDKVETLGVKLKQLALEESIRINLAYETLRRAGVE